MLVKKVIEALLLTSKVVTHLTPWSQNDLCLAATFSKAIGNAGRFLLDLHHSRDGKDTVSVRNRYTDLRQLSWCQIEFQFFDGLTQAGTRKDDLTVVFNQVRTPANPRFVRNLLSWF